MAAMKPRTSDGPLEVTQERRRTGPPVPLRGAVADRAAAERGPFLPGGGNGLVASYEACGAAGEVTGAPADLGAGLVRLLLLGTGDGSAAALRRAGAVLGRRVAAGRTAVAT